MKHLAPHATIFCLAFALSSLLPLLGLLVIPIYLMIAAFIREERLAEQRLEESVLAMVKDSQTWTNEYRGTK